MPDVLRKTGWVLGAFVVFDIVGVGLSLLLDLVALVDRHWESSAALGYVIWFVMGVFCAACIYGQVVREDWESPAGRRTGTLAVAITAVVAVVLGMLASLVWAGGDFAEPVAPDHAGVTITYLATTVLAVALARFVVFRDASGDRPKTLSVTEAATDLAGPTRETELFVPRQATSRRSRLPGGLPGRRVAEDDGEFRPAGFWMTLGFVLGVPVLLFLDVAMFLLGPFDRFDRWTDPLLSTAVIGGVAWGFAAARWEAPRMLLVALHAPLFLGAMFYLFAVLIGGLLVGFGVSDGLASLVSMIGFWIGFALGGVAAGALVMAMFSGTATDVPEKQR